MPRPAKSPAEHMLQGTTPSAVEGETLVPGRPRYPKGINAAARAAFKRLTQMLEQRQHATPGDEEILRLYAILFDRHARALVKLADGGEIVRYARLNNHGEAVYCEKPSLWLKVAEICESKMLACLTALGLTPSARRNVRRAEPPKQVIADPFEELISKRQIGADPSTDVLADIDEELLQ